MAWEIEEQHIDKALGLHRYILVDKTVIQRDGQPARFHYDIALGSGIDGESCPHCHAPMRRSHVLHGSGRMLLAEHLEAALNEPHLGKRIEMLDKADEMNPRDEVKGIIDQLNAFHDRMEKYARRHSVPVYKGPKAK
jgi:hypothetical protein